MGNVLNQQHDPPRLWEIRLFGHITDVEIAVEAVIDSQQEVYCSHTIMVGDTDETEDLATAEISLRLKDETMILLVESILDDDHQNVRIIYNGEKRRDL